MNSPTSNHGAPRYTIDELLGMRSSLPVVICALKEINKQFDIAGIFHLPDEAIRHAERFSCKTKALVSIVNKSKAASSTKRNAGLSSEDSEYHSRSESSTHRELRQTQWAFRRRDSSERSSQPYSAPPGLAAQKSENFQRFYRAVVSPTHVRVTAGGRIVPNTRVAPPSYEWNGDKLQFEANEVPQEDSSTREIAAWNPQNNQFAAGLPSLVPAGFMPPYGVLPHVNSGALQVMSLQPSGSFSTEQKAPGSEMVSSIRNEPHSLPQQIKLSPPTQFDQTKPFMINGQHVFPIPQGYQPPNGAMPMAVGMIGNPNFFQPQPQPPFFPHGFQMPVANMPGPFMFPPGPPIQAPVLNVGQSPLGMSIPGMLPPEMLERYIDTLRSHVKEMDFQLAANQNQLNEAFVMQFVAQRNAHQAHIENFERQLSVYASAGVIGHRNNDSVNAVHLPASSSDENKLLLPANQLSTPALSQQSPVVKSVEHAVKDAETKNEDAPVETKTTGKPRSESKSRLSAAAAKAPPFQPRAQATITENDNFAGFAHPPPTEPAQHRTQAQMEANKIMSYASLPRSNSLHEPSSQNGSGVSAFQRSQTFHGKTAPSAVLAREPNIPPDAVPYLVGTLPAGATVVHDGIQEMVYGRPLSAEEVRARYLYWGKAPRSVQSGLPKFDGKDFYPPSPVKENARVFPPPSGRYAPRLPIPDFEQLFTEPGVPGYKAASPARATASLQNMNVATQQPFVNNGTGYRALQPQSTNRSFQKNELSLNSVVNSNALALYEPATPEPKKQTGDNMQEEDYSGLFTERGVPGYKSPTPPRPIQSGLLQSNRLTNHTSVVPQSSETTSTDAGERHWVHTRTEVPAPGTDAGSETSTVEINLTPQKKASPKRKDDETPFAERVANFNTEQQTLFLQNMLKNTATMSGPALLGGVTSANAQGYLPQYRGSAIPSLSPVVLNGSSPSVHTWNVTSNKPAHNQDGSTAAGTVAKGPENRPLSRAIPIVRPAPEGMDAEAYMRYLHNAKADDDKKAQGWNSNTSGTGPVTGSDW